MTRSTLAPSNCASSYSFSCQFCFADNGLFRNPHPHPDRSSKSFQRNFSFEVAFLPGRRRLFTDALDSYDFGGQS